MAVVTSVIAMRLTAMPRNRQETAEITLIEEEGTSHPRVLSDTNLCAI